MITSLLKGLDLTKTATALMISKTRSDEMETGDDLKSLISVFPTQGALQADETMDLYFVFSPRYEKSCRGWKNSAKNPPRKDYALFVNIEVVGVINQNVEGEFKHGRTANFFNYSLFLGMHERQVKTFLSRDFVGFFFVCGGGGRGTGRTIFSHYSMVE